MVSKTAPLPNVKRIFQPDEGYILAECDLKQADAQVMAWEAEDPILKDIFKAGKDLHNENASTIYGPDYTRPQRQDARQIVHAVHYVSSAKGLALRFGITVGQGQAFISMWRRLHPWIFDLHERVQHQLEVDRFVTNIFGFQRFFFDRPEGILPEAVAWIPQSTVAIAINKGILQVGGRIYDCGRWVHRGKFPYVEWLLQVHDSAVFQIPERYENDLPEIRKTFEVEMPYEGDPWAIPVTMKTSRRSWGDAV